MSLRVSPEGPAPPKFGWTLLALCTISEILVQVLARSLIGNPVIIGDGPAAVIGDEHRRLMLCNELKGHWEEKENL